MHAPLPANSDSFEPRLPAVYGREFWFTYLANTTLMVAVSLLFRYGDFVSMVGGREVDLGWIVGVGAIGSLAMRLAQGAGVDRYGPRLIWLLSLVGVVGTLLLHLLVTSAHGPMIYAVRVAYHTGLAGAFGASITYISLRAPVMRMAEMIGMLGSSGFVGMALGSLLGDALCSADTLTRTHVDRMFLCAAGLAVISLLSACAATRGQVRPPARRRPPLAWLIGRYHPGTLLLMGIMMGLALGLPGTFLRPYTQRLGIQHLGWFFVTYSATAFAMRLATRRVPDRIGVRPSILLGMAAVTVGTLLYLTVGKAWELIFPGIAFGVAHALLFPAVVAGGSRTFPARYRGLGVALMLGMFDIGNLVGMPLVGTIVDTAPRWGLPAYPTMFLAVAGLIVCAATWFAVRPLRGKNAQQEVDAIAELEPAEVA